MSSIISLILFFFFFRWVLQFIFGKGNSSGMSFAFIGQIFSVLKKIVVAFFKLFGWIISSFVELMTWVFKTSVAIIKWLFRVLIYNPSM